MSTNLAQSLVRDLLSEDLEMLHCRAEFPNRISIFVAPDANQEVQTALQRFQDNLITRVDPDNLYSEVRRYMPLLNVPGKGLFLQPHTLVLVLFYPTETQRMLELSLDSEKGILNLHK